jgi:hypothetical protein
MMTGRESIDIIGVVEYNFSCSCGWWGVLRIAAEREQVKCVKCGQVYVQTQKDDNTYELDTRVH